MAVAEDYRVLREGTGARWIDRDFVMLSGPDATGYLQGQCSQDVAMLEGGSSAEALLLSPQGKLDALVRVTCLADAGFLVDVEGGFGPSVVERLARFKLRVKVEIEVLDWKCLALRGPGALGSVAPSVRWESAKHSVRSQEAGRGAMGAGGDRRAQLVLAVEWGGAVGADIVGEAPEPPEHATIVSEEAWEALRIESGIPRMGLDIDERTIAVEAGLVERCVSFTKGCYTGQELVARLDARGSNVARRLVGVVCSGAPEGWCVPKGARLVGGDKVVGTVTSSAWSPRLGGVAMAYVRRGTEPETRVAVRLDGDEPGESAGMIRSLPLAPPHW